MGWESLTRTQTWKFLIWVLFKKVGREGLKIKIPNKKFPYCPG